MKFAHSIRESIKRDINELNKTTRELIKEGYSHEEILKHKHVVKLMRTIQEKKIDLAITERDLNRPREEDEIEEEE